MPDNTNILTTGSTRWIQPRQPEKDPLQSQNLRTQNRLAFLVGLVALCLPIIMILGARLDGGCYRDSISHYYYAQVLGSIFVGLLSFIGGFMIAYSGEHWVEDTGSFIAGVGAFFVAIFPTIGNGCEDHPGFLSRVFVQYHSGPPDRVVPMPDGSFFMLFPDVGDVHRMAASVLFIYLGVYCLVVMRRIVPERHIRDNRLIESKRRRNLVYGICGYTILGCVTLLACIGFLTGPEFKVWWNQWNLTFVFETTMLWAFALAWFTKGRQFRWMNDPAPV